MNSRLETDFFGGEIIRRIVYGYIRVFVDCLIVFGGYRDRYESRVREDRFGSNPKIARVEIGGNTLHNRKYGQSEGEIRRCYEFIGNNGIESLGKRSGLG